MPELNRVLLKMLDRLRAGLIDGPALNCRPHQSRQRIDLKQFEKLSEFPAAALLLELLGPGKKGSLTVSFAKTADNGSPDARASGDNDRPADQDDPDARLKRSGKDDKARKPTLNDKRSEPSLNRRFQSRSPDDLLAQQQFLLRKLQHLIEDARVHEEDTGVYVLNLGFPLISLPPGKNRPGASQRRILAPLAFIPVTVSVKTRPKTTIEIACRADEVDRVVPNPSLLAWLEQAGLQPPAGLFADESVQEPWHEIAALAHWVADACEIRLPELFADFEPPSATKLALVASPRADESDEPAILVAAVLGLFPVNNQALLRDMEAMVEDDALSGPARSFIDVAAALDGTEHQYAPLDSTVEPSPADGAAELAAANQRLVSMADPCQARAVRLARSASGLVIHGPPGTGKSQTITNIVGDHLARGERVLVVCDKRTALDVVADRLSHLGLGSLVAVVHDPGRDQRDLYRSVRDQLENLVDSRTDPHAERDVCRLDRELDSIRAEIVAARQLLHEARSDDHPAFHEAVGRWLKTALVDEGLAACARVASERWPVSLAELDARGRDLRDLFWKAEVIQYRANPWSECVSIGLSDFLSRSGDDIRGELRKCLAAAVEADAQAVPAIPEFDAELSLRDQVAARQVLASHVERLTEKVDAPVVEHFLELDAAAWDLARRRLEQASSIEAIFRSGPLDAELWLLWGRALPDSLELTREIGALERYATVSGKWYVAFCFRERAKAREALTRYGLGFDRAAAGRLLGFLRGLQARRVLRSLLSSVAGRNDQPDDAKLDDDRSLIISLDTHHHLLGALCATERDPNLKPVKPFLRHALTDRGLLAALLEGLQQSSSRADKIVALDDRLKASGLFDRDWIERSRRQRCQGLLAASTMNALLEKLPDCESVVRIHDGLEGLPAGLREAVTELLHRDLAAEEACASLEKLAWEQEAKSRLATTAELQRLDGDRLTHSVQRFRSVRAAKHQKVAAAILHRWTETQRNRLLASTRSRLNSDGADVRRRLTIQGDRALRLRKVIDIGADIPGGDPLFDLRPVWMASPETVAQVFARQPIFDVIVFDEASQCRLEEALPVLARGKRVVIAGDTKQLPPTRFFESAVVTSENDDAQTEQDWFELQQRDVEDLLTAALNLQIEECYLDVHYRSRNADLIDFSNRQFYASRLQPIPGHPSFRTRFAPITLYHAQGVYEERVNRIEAEAVCQIVRDLLRRAEPPSIGIACFNTDQRDLIVECLDELARADHEFAERLADSRARKGRASSESLFVKNLENVQGDERDHIIVSTTYGPDPDGRFYRRFGPLGRSGGGRRLNVLVTRARHEVHLVTSIPAAIYRNIPPLQPGQTPNGAWLLFSYLAHAEFLAAAYARANEILDQRDELASAGLTGALAPSVDVRECLAPSAFAEGLAGELARRHGMRSEVYWGNDGFCVDVAIGHPRFVEDVTIGLLCDLNRYRRADDPVEWEIFRTDVLEATGWKLLRIWSPQFFRDPQSACQTVVGAVSDFLVAEDAKNALRVSPK